MDMRRPEEKVEVVRVCGLEGGPGTCGCEGWNGGRRRVPRFDQDRRVHEWQIWESGSTVGTTEVYKVSEFRQHGAATDFRDSIEELEATYPEPGAVSDDPEVLRPCGSSENDYHPAGAWRSLLHPKLIRPEDPRI